MTEQQYNILKAHKGIYDFYVQVQTVNSAHPSVGAINQVLTELGMPIQNMACGQCVANGLETAYNLFNEYERNNQS